MVLVVLLGMVWLHWFHLAPAWNTWCTERKWARAVTAIGHLTYTQLLIVVGGISSKRVDNPWDPGEQLLLYLLTVQAFALWGWTVSAWKIKEIWELLGLFAIWIGYLVLTLMT